jgi:hypothetical protein
VQVAQQAVDDTDVQPDVRVVALQISAPPKIVKAGDSFVLTATPLDYRGGFVPGHTVQWSTSDVGVALVTGSGWVATLGRGPVVLQASCEGAIASVSINVEEAAPATKRVKPVALKPPRFEPPAEQPRPVRRRRMPRSRRRRLLAASVGILVLTPVLWLYGGLRDFLSDSSGPSGVAPALNDADPPVTPPGEPVAAILRGVAAAVTIERSPRGPLVPGASARLLAEVRDLAGRTVSGSSVSWSSTNPGVARVDSASGWVHAVRPGRARVVAASGEWRASVPIVVRRPTTEPSAVDSVSSAPDGSPRVGDTVTPAAAVLDDQGAPREGGESEAASSQPTALTTDPSTDTFAVQGYEPPPGPPDEIAAEPASTVAEDRDGARRRLEAGVLTGVQECYDALRSKDVARVTELYRPTTKSDKEKLNKLTRILRTEEWSAVVGERVDGTRQLDGARPKMEFRFQLVWKDAFGGRLSSRPVFRAEFARNGNEWQISSCRIVGSPKL